MGYDDGSEVEVVCDEDPDEPGVDIHDVLATATDEDFELGDFLGAMIDIDDDEDDGSKWAGVTKAEIEAMAEANRQPPT